MHLDDSRPGETSGEVSPTSTSGALRDVSCRQQNTSSRPLSLLLWLLRVAAAAVLGCCSHRHITARRHAWW